MHSCLAACLTHALPHRCHTPAPPGLPVMCCACFGRPRRCFFAAIQSFWAVMVELFLAGRSFSAADPEDMALVGKWRRRARKPAPECTPSGKPVTTVVMTADSRKVSILAKAE